MRDIEIIVLGTAGSAPTKERGLSAIAIRYDGRIFLMDCGEGTQRQMMRYGLNISKIDAIFITHIHGDHVIGIAGLMRTLALYNRTRPLNIYVPEGYENNVKMLVDFDAAMILYKVNIVGVHSGKIYSDGGISVRAFRLRHSIPAYGYAFSEDDRPHFIKSEAKRLGIDGRMFSEIEKRGRITANGKTVRLSQITKTVKGKKVVYAADTRPVQSTLAAARDADLLIHDSSYASEDAELARSRMHSTAEEAAKIAKRAGAKRLLLTHLSARYKNVNAHLKESRRIFRNTDVAEDGMRIVV